jgi:hypothetical protein
LPGPPEDAVTILTDEDIQQTMTGVDWEAVERLLRPCYPADPLHDWPAACRMARQTAYLGESFDGFDGDRAQLLCFLNEIRGRAADPLERRHWMRPLRDAGVALPMQTWLWIALERFLETPVTDEERVAHDAVALERVGAMGVARAFMRSGRDGQPMAETVEALQRMIAEAVFLTPAGRRLGVRRIVYARRFLKELEEE